LHTKTAWKTELNVCRIPSELGSFLCERRLERKSSEACATACQNCYSVFPSGMTSHSKIPHFNRECISPFRSRWTKRRKWKRLSICWDLK
jgi:hypothetical protein